MKIESAKNNINFTSIVPLIVMKNGEAVVQEAEITKAVRILSEYLSQNKNQNPSAGLIQKGFQARDRSFCNPKGEYIKVNTTRNGNSKHNTIKSFLENGDMYLATGDQANDINKLSTQLGITQNKIIKTLEENGDAKLLFDNYRQLTKHLNELMAKYVYSSPLLRLREGFNFATREYHGNEVALVLNVKDAEKAKKGAHQLNINSIEFINKETMPTYNIIPKQRGLRKAKSVIERTKPTQPEQPLPTQKRSLQPAFSTVVKPQKRKEYIPNQTELNFDC